MPRNHANKNRTAKTNENIQILAIKSIENISKKRYSYSFGADEFTLRFTSDDLFWVFVVGGIPTVAGLVLGHLVRSVGKTKEAGIGLTIGGVMNIILDPIFIFVFGMQVAGAAVATMLSNVISMLYFLWCWQKSERQVLLHCRQNILRWPKKFLWELYLWDFRQPFRCCWFLFPFPF